MLTAATAIAITANPTSRTTGRLLLRRSGAGTCQDFLESADPSWPETEAAATFTVQAPPSCREPASKESRLLAPISSRSTTNYRLIVQTQNASFHTLVGEKMLDSFPITSPAKPTAKLRFADVAVTATANEFAGIYRNKPYHQADFDAVIERALATGVEKIMLTGMSLSDVSFNLGIAKRHPGTCYITIGVHPYHASEADADEAYLDHLVQAVDDTLKLNPCPIAAFGELGLDYDRLNRSPKEAQLRVFQHQLDLFVKHIFDLPLFLHCRAAFDDFCETIKPYLPSLPRRGLVHSFVGTAAQMRVLIDMGFDISVNGFSFRDEASLQMVRDIPLDRLQIETDAPWGEIPANLDVAKRYLVNAHPMPPTKKRDKFQLGLMVKDRNESRCIDRVAFVTAGLRGVSVEEIAGAAWENSTKMFRLREGVDYAA